MFLWPLQGLCEITGAALDPGAALVSANAAASDWPDYIMM